MAFGDALGPGQTECSAKILSRRRSTCHQDEAAMRLPGQGEENQASCCSPLAAAFQIQSQSAPAEAEHATPGSPDSSPTIQALHTLPWEVASLTHSETNRQPWSQLGIHSHRGAYQFMLRPSWCRVGQISFVDTRLKAIGATENKEVTHIQYQPQPWHTDVAM